jgi:cyclophilin family peptidyl-prolyl cis-trans isomerase
MTSIRNGFKLGLAATLGALLASCEPLRDPDATAPDGDSDLRVTATANAAVIFEGDSVQLTATAARGTPPYRFRWDQNGGPADLDLADTGAASLSAGPLNITGRYSFRVEVIDSDGRSAIDFAAVEVLAAIEATASPLAVIGEPVELRATLAEPSNTATFLWEVSQGTADLATPTFATTTLTARAAETLIVNLMVTLLPGSAPSVRQFEIAAIEDLSPRVRIETTMGELAIELDAQAAPQHTANFLLYVDDGFYDGLLIHRVACSGTAPEGECDPFVVQGGGYRRVGEEIEEVPPTRDAVPSEADNGLSNGTLYSVALALRGSDPNSGTTQFFVNLSEDNARLDDLGFTVFGQVVVGQEVIDQMTQVERTGNPVLGGETSLPVEDIIIERAIRLSISD